MNQKIYQNSEIVQELKSVLNVASNALLGEVIGVSRQSINQYEGKTGVDINNKFISALIDHIKEHKDRNLADDIVKLLKEHGVPLS